MCLGLSQGGRQGDGQPNSKQSWGPGRQHALTLFPCPAPHVHVRVCSRVCTARGVWAHGWGAASACVGLTGKARVSAWAAEARGVRPGPGTQRGPAWHCRGLDAGVRTCANTPTRWAPLVQGPQDVGKGLRRSRGQPQASGPRHTPLYHTWPRHPNTHTPVGTCSLDMGRGEQDGCLSLPESPPGVPPPPGWLQDRPAGTLPPPHSVRPSSGGPPPFGGAAGVRSGQRPRLPSPQQPREHPRLSLPHRARPRSPPAEGLEGGLGFLCRVMGPGVGIEAPGAGAGVGGGRPPGRGSGPWAEAAEGPGFCRRGSKET